MSPSALKGHHTEGAGARTFCFAIPVGLVMVLVVVVGLVPGPINSAPGALQDGTPVESSPASPAASPAASPTAIDLGPSTQIIVGEITIEIIDEGFIPVHFESAVGRDVAITVVNSGTRTHNFSIDAFDIDIDLEPGDSATVEIENPRISTYRYYSDLPGDEDLEGTMTVFI